MNAWLAPQALAAMLAQAQPSPQVEPVTVDRASPGQVLLEPHLTAHPRNPNHLLAAAIVSPALGSFEERVTRQTCASWLSLDAGKTWQRHDFPVVRCWDPWVAITPDGQATFTALGTHPALTQQGRAGAAEGLIAFRSADGGRTWDDEPIGLGPDHDHPTTAVDTGSSKRAGWIYLVSHHTLRADDGKVRSAVFVTRSRNGGKTFDEPVNLIPNNLDNLAEMAVVLSDGTLVVSFVDAGHPSEAPAGGLFERRRAWVLRSSDGGHTFSMPLFANDACGPPPKFRLSALTVDASSGPFRDRLYFACRQKGGGPIVISSSKDAGETWSAPVAVAPGTPAVNERIPGLAVNDRGVLGVAWIDAPGEPGHRCEQGLHFAPSTDGGRTFLPEQRISFAPACPESETDLHPTGGDYFGMVGSEEGFRLLWSEMRDGVSQLRTSTVGVEVGR